LAGEARCGRWGTARGSACGRGAVRESGSPCNLEPRVQDCNPSGACTPPAEVAFTRSHSSAAPRVAGRRWVDGPIALLNWWYAFPVRRSLLKLRLAPPAAMCARDYAPVHRTQDDEARAAPSRDRHGWLRTSGLTDLGMRSQLDEACDAAESAADGAPLGRGGQARSIGLHCPVYFELARLQNGQWCGAGRVTSAHRGRRCARPLIQVILESAEQ
jgi:hypothetical protein